MTTIETRRPTNDVPETTGHSSVGDHLPHPTTRLPAPMGSASGGDPTTQAAIVAAQTSEGAPPGSQLPRPTLTDPMPKSGASGGDPNSTVSQEEIAAHHADADRGSTSALGQGIAGSHGRTVEGGSNSQQARAFALPNGASPAGADAARDQTATAWPMPRRATLFDPALAFAADILDDTEGLWVANSNRLRILTTPHDQADSDGEYRGFGLTEADADVARLAAMVATLDQLTKDATKHLEKVMRRHPLHPWVKAQKGLGDKQVARLLAAIGDPYWNTLHDRPRTVSELWAYCGLHVLPAGQTGVAPRRQRGQKSNWSETARKRAWLIANSVVKCGGPYREIYDATKAKYADAAHTSTCVRCGPKGKPAQPGSPVSKAHIHARGLRAISKAVLRDLWIEAKRIHEECA